MTDSTANVPVHTIGRSALVIERRSPGELGSRRSATKPHRAH